MDTSIQLPTEIAKEIINNLKPVDLFRLCQTSMFNQRFCINNQDLDKFIKNRKTIAAYHNEIMFIYNKQLYFYKISESLRLQASYDEIHWDSELKHIVDLNKLPISITHDFNNFCVLYADETLDIINYKSDKKLEYKFENILFINNRCVLTKNNLYYKFTVLSNNFFDSQDILSITVDKSTFLYLTTKGIYIVDINRTTPELSVLQTRPIPLNVSFKKCQIYSDGRKKGAKLV